MKKRKKVLVIVGVIIAAFVFGGAALLNQITENAKGIPVTEPDLAALADGAYDGAYSIQPVSVKVKVSVENQEITDVEILEHFCGFGQKAETLTKEIVERQSLQVDAVSGATVSSKCILKAVENALQTD